MFSRLYLEITTCCNRACSFCPGTARPAAFVTPETFRTLAAKLRPYGQYLYLHVMGEPLLHPQLPELLEICRALDFRVTLTTNGTLLPARQPVLLAAPALRKVSVSLHSFEANEAGDFRAYLTGCTDFARAAMAAGVLTDFRLWNLDGAQTKGLHDRNDEILAHLHAAFSEPWQRNTWGWRLAKGVFVSFGERFDWPDAQAADRGALGRCRALSDQLAVLSDGTVVPCCLDHEGTLALGNLLRQDLPEISPLLWPARSAKASRKASAPPPSAAAAATPNASADPKSPLPGVDPPIRGKCPEGTKGVGMLARRSRD